MIVWMIFGKKLLLSSASMSAIYIFLKHLPTGRHRQAVVKFETYNPGLDHVGATHSLGTTGLAAIGLVIESPAWNVLVY